MTRSLTRSTVGRTEKKLGDLRHSGLAAEIETALYLQVCRLGFVTDGDHVVKDAPLSTLAERDDVGRKHRGTRLRRNVCGGINRHTRILPLAATTVRPRSRAMR